MIGGLVVRADHRDRAGTIQEAIRRLEDRGLAPSSAFVDPYDRCVLIGRGARVVHSGELRGFGVVTGFPRTVTGAGFDVEVLIAAALENPERTAQACRGAFAIAVWSCTESRLVLVRDHLGQRGLFYRNDPEGFGFASRFALLHDKLAADELDIDSIIHYLAFGAPPSGRTLATAIRRVPAAYMVDIVAKSAPRMRRYWSPLVPDAPTEVDDSWLQIASKTLAAATAVAISRPQLGVLLSGGIDSSYLAYWVAAQQRQVDAFTIEFIPDTSMNETEYAAAAAVRFGHRHHVVAIGPEEAYQILEREVLAADEPCAAWATISQFALMLAASHMGVRTMLSGLGADEIFGGYDHFRGYYARLVRYARRRGVTLAGALAEALMIESTRATQVLYPGVARLFDDNALARILAPAYRDWSPGGYLRGFYRDCLATKPDAHYMELMIAHECQHRIPDLLFANFEPVAQRFGIEIHYPYLIPELVEHVAALEMHWRYRTRKGEFSLELRRLLPRFKHAMLMLVESALPREILDRPRKSLTAPFGAWMFQSSFGTSVLENLATSRLWDLGIVNRERLAAIVEKCVPGPSPWVFQLWGLVTLAGWVDRNCR